MAVCFLMRNKKKWCRFRWLVSWGGLGGVREGETVIRI